VSRLPATLILLGALACTPYSPDEELSSTPEAAEPPAPAPAIPHLEPEPEPELLPPGTPAVPGFALYTHDQTILVPIDGSPRVIGEGLWVQDDRVSPPALTHTLIMSKTRAATMALPRCPCLALEGACEDASIESRLFDPHTGALVSAPEQPCTCMRLEEELAFPPTEIDGEEYEACMTWDDEVLVSMVAGRLLYSGIDHNGACHGGWSVYDAFDTFHALIDDPPAPSSDGMRSVGCADMEYFFEAPSWPIDRSALETKCEDYFESEVFMLRRGELWAVREDASHAHGTHWYLKRAVRPDSCPSINDPCGGPQPFDSKAKLDRKRREFWIMTDGSAALTAERSSYALWRADSEESIEFELPNIDAATDVIGVRIHADIGPLRALMGKHPTLGLERPERAPTTMDANACLAEIGEKPGPEADASKLGRTCFMYIGIEQWTSAETYCQLGLSIAQAPETRGAILFNLGLIAEAEGAREQAGVYYHESLAARPGNRTVERKLERLKLP
jgi:hypothetical protein